MRSGVIVAVVVASLATACTGSSRDESPGNTTTSGSTATDPTTAEAEPSLSEPPPSESTAPDDAAAAPDVLVAEGAAVIDGVANSLVIVHDLDGGENALVSYRADGTVVATYSEGPDESIWQPIWAPDGRRLAWTRTTDGATWELVTAAVDGTDRTTRLLPGRPDYITYDPTGARIMALTPSPDGFGLVIVEIDGTPPGDPEEPLTVIDVGQPYFSDFSPAGDRVIAHVGSEMRLVDLTGARETLDFTSAGHQTPSWHPSEASVVFAADDALGNRLVMHELATGVTSELATFDSFVWFDLDPTGSRVAVSAFGGDGDGSLVAFGGPRRQTAPALGGGLLVVALADGDTKLLDPAPTVAPMWDPTGSQVLVRNSLRGIGRWSVHQLDGTRTGTIDFDVDGSLVPAYLPFWDQYARSQTLWSPDGRQFVHVGRSDSGKSGVWIHDASTSGASSFLIDGDLAWWSPT